METQTKTREEDTEVAALGERQRWGPQEELVLLHALTDREGALGG
jgi:hypothetical protein